jgi:serine/threonine-protein kinase HipA
MANLLWGKVYYKDIYAGILREEPGDRVAFEYDESYLNSNYPSIAYTLPKTLNKHTSENGLHAFFDNLVSEGWLEQAQSRLLGKRISSRFELLLAFGYDCAGAISVIDPDPFGLSTLFLDTHDPKEMAVLTSRASLSGVQPKLAIVERSGKYYPAQIGELSTHIAKFPSTGHEDLIINEYLTTLAFKALCPNDDVVDLSIKEIEGVSEIALVIKRFDRNLKERLHFEEFNQLLGKKSNAKYTGSHREMSDFIKNTKGCLLIENYRLYGRILAGLLLGNTDMHFKNFGPCFILILDFV